MSNPRDTPCPHCGRPMGFEYVDVEPGKCQLWRWMYEGSSQGRALAPRTLTDCFALTSRRIRELTAALADAKTVAAAAQRALSRHHTTDTVKAEPFRDGARIEVG